MDAELPATCSPRGDVDMAPGGADLERYSRRYNILLLCTPHLQKDQINERTLELIAHYVACDNSMGLRTLQMDQCGLNGEHVALLMYAMTKTPGEARNLEFHVSSNRLEKGIGEIVKAIETNHAPSHLFLRMIEFNKEEHFRRASPS
jgi:hypothetical protein